MIDEEITLRKLEVLVAFVQHENLSRTAEALHLSTVSVHRALHSLESAMRCALFRHEGRSLKPLPSALLLAEQARSLLAELETSIQATRSLSGFAAQHIRVGTLFSLTIDTMPRLMMGMKIRRPELALQLTMGSNTELLFRLNNMELDAVILSLDDSINYTGLEVIPMFRDSIYLASPLGFAHENPWLADLSHYRDEKFVALADGFTTGQGFRHACAIAGFEPQIAMQVSDIFSLTNLVAGGVGHALLPGRIRTFFADRVCFTPLQAQYQTKQNIGMLFLHSRERDPNLLALAAEARMLGHATTPSA